MTHKLGIFKGLWVFNSLMNPVPKGVQLTSSDFSAIKSGTDIPSQYRSTGSVSRRIQDKLRPISSLTSAVVEQVIFDFIWLINYSSFLQKEHRCKPSRRKTY